ncbi:hypothetical protein D3C71_688590 [compost metagenome]
MPLFISADTPAPAPHLVGIEEGIERAARYIEKQRDDYVQEFGNYDPSTGATEFSTAGEEYLSTLEELIDGIRALGTNHGCKSDLHPEYVPSAGEA